MSKTRSFVITNWNLDTDYEALVKQGQIRFIAYGKEICPDTGKHHHQAFCYFHTQRTFGKRALNNIGNMFGPIHCFVKPMKGNFRQNENYCSKEGVYTEVGVKPKQGFRGDLVETKDAILDGTITVDEIALEDPQSFHMYGRTFKEIEMIALRKRYRTEMTQGVWIVGPSGSGKSHTAFEGYNPETHYVKNLNEDWWDGYKGQETVILNEFRGQIAFAELLDLCDKWPKTVKWRGREPVPFLAKKVIVTSIKEPNDVYRRQCDDEPWEQFARRFDIIRLTPRGVEL